MVFGTDKIFCPTDNVDWQLTKEKCRTQRLKNNHEENKTQITHEYKIGYLALMMEKGYIRAKKSKLSIPTEGPDEILQIFMNGNVHICRGNYDKYIYPSPVPLLSKKRQQCLEPKINHYITSSL